MGRPFLGVEEFLERWRCVSSAVQQRSIRARDIHARMATEQERRLISVAPTGVDEPSHTYR